MFDASLFLTLNNYGYSNENLAMVKDYLRTRKIPESIDNSGKRKRFLAKWEKDFKVENNKLIYIPRKLEVVPDDKRYEVLLNIYKNLHTGVGQGVTMFYHRITDNFLNIRRKDVSDFLKSQKLYQITRPQNHIQNKPILAKSPNERWGIDCINMVSYANANGGDARGWKFILTIVDYFSRKVWLRPLKAQTAVNVRNSLINLVQETKTYPKIIQADNGTEFQGETTDWMKQNNIVYVKTLSYSPESNGLVEGKNKIVRKILREIMIRQNSRNWTNYLKTTTKLMNSQRNGTTKENPDNLWKEGHELQGEMNNGVIALHKKRIANAVKNNSTKEYKVGDYVRVKMGTLYSNVRKLIKSGDKKLIVVNYSPTIYQIKSVLKKDIKDKVLSDNVISYEKSRYTLKNLDGTSVQTQQKLNNPDKERRDKRFFASDFQLVKNPDTDGSYLEYFGVNDALKLNKKDLPLPIAVERALPRPLPIVGAVLPLPIIQDILPVPIQKDDLIGRKMQKTFKGYGKKLFVGKIMSYDSVEKYYKVKYDDGDEAEYTKSQINKYLIPLPNEHVRRPVRQVVIGGQIYNF